MRLWEVTYELRHGGMTITEKTVELWLDAVDDDDARYEARQELPRNSYITSVYEIGNAGQ